MKEIGQDQPVFAPLRLGAQDQMDVFGFFPVSGRNRKNTIGLPARAG
jgi:hypothetical protein